MQFSKIAEWLKSKVVSHIEYGFIPHDGENKMRIDEIHFDDGSSLNMGGAHGFAVIDEVVIDGKEISPVEDPDEFNTDPEMGAPALDQFKKNAR